MAIRRFTMANDNIELYGRMLVDNPTRPAFLYPVGFQPQFGILSLTQAYLRNPFWFGQTGISLHELRHCPEPIKDLPLEEPLSAFGHGLVFAEEDGLCQTMSQNAWHFLGKTVNMFSSIEVHCPVTKKLYLIYSLHESIFGDICSIQEGLESIESLGDETFEDRQLFLVNEIKEEPGRSIPSILEPIVFSRGSDGFEIYPVEGFTLFKQDDQMYLLFNEALESEFKVVFFRCDNPSIYLKCPDGLAEDGLFVEHTNFPYSHMELSYRIK